MLIIQHIAEAARTQEYQNCVKLGYSLGAAIDSSWAVYNEVISLGRAGILERKV